MKYWFKRRRYGYGWTPATLQAWTLLLTFIAVIAVGILFIEWQNLSTLLLIVFVILALALFIAITAKHSPKPKWRWGKRADDNPEEDW